MSFGDEDDIRVPAWIRENRRSGRWNDVTPRLSPGEKLIADRDGTVHRFESMAGALTTGACCYLFDGPTFPVADGGSAVKAAFVRSLVASGTPVIGVGADWGWEPRDACGRHLSIPMVWIPPVDYFTGDCIAAMLEQVGAGALVADSLETMARLSHRRLPSALLLFDFYPQLWEQRGVGRTEIDRAIDLLRSLDPVTTRILVRCPDDAHRVRAVAPELDTVVLGGIAVPSSGAPSVFDADGPAVCIGNFHYGPNRDGLVNLARHWNGGRRLRVVGSVPHDLAGELGRHGGIDLTGVVPGLDEAFAGAACGVAPVRVGGGTSIKTIDYAAWGLPIISTRVGVRGLEQDLVDCCLVVDDIPSLATAVGAFDPADQDVASRAARARSIVAARYDVASQVGAAASVIRTLR